MDTFDQQQGVRSRRGTLRAVQTSAFARLRGQGPLDITRLSGEQSNTSLVYGNRLILKLFRRLQPGINPDFEIGRQLTERIGYPRVPAVAGAVEYQMTAEKPMTIAMLQQLVESQADGWRHATDEISRFFEAVAGSTPPPGAVPDSLTDAIGVPYPEAIDAMAGYAATAETLGRRTAEVHLALAADTSNPAFSPEPFTAEDLADVRRSAVAQARSALDALRDAMEGSATRLPEDVAARAQTLLDNEQEVIDQIKATAAAEFIVAKGRIHGDYHLGQVLWAEGDFYLIDFEGEPARPIAERRAKQSPIKDVAGMLRSFSYAAYAGLFAHSSTRPGQFAELEPWARLWETWASAAFLSSYLATAGQALIVPPEAAQRNALIQLFMLDKAFYELNYELNNRPDWVRIPLAAILDVIGSK
jgi:maltose alpha-D-glucosyltransferase / alpha-amylase